ncbi:MAG: zinc ribbon domain-containing protein [Promethearchaeota archaeon]
MSPYCTYCGNEVEESWNVCPNCGKGLKEQVISQTQPQQQPQMHPQPIPYQVQPYQKVYGLGGGNNYGIAALICGILGIPLGIVFVGPVLGIIAIIMGGIGISKDDNAAIAIIGLILGILDFVFFFILFFWFFIWFGWLWPWW